MKTTVKKGVFFCAFDPGKGLVKFFYISNCRFVATIGDTFLLKAVMHRIERFLMPLEKMYIFCIWQKRYIEQHVDTIHRSALSTKWIFAG